MNIGAAKCSLEIKAMFTLYWIAFRVGIKIYRIGLLFTLEHGNFGMIFIWDSYRGVEGYILYRTAITVIQYVSDRFQDVSIASVNT